MGKLLQYLKKYWLFALLASGFMVAEVYVDLYQPRMMQRIVDEGILGVNNGGVSNLDLVISTGLRMLLIVLVGGLCGIGSGLFTNITGQEAVDAGLIDALGTLSDALRYLHESAGT